MITILTDSSLFTYDLFHICKAFYPKEEITQKVEPELEVSVRIKSEFFEECFEIAKSQAGHQKSEKHEVNQKLYRWLQNVSGREIAWGILTGIRPTKLMLNQYKQGKSEAQVIDWMKNEYLVSDTKARLGMEIAKREDAQLSKLDYEDGFSLYVGIPFCPTTCAYCSFTSYPLEKWVSRVDEYLDAVFREIDFAAKAAVRSGKHLDTIYIGGGTPTTLSARQMDRLLTGIEQSFDLKELKEFTVEAGRPDSITREKLGVLKAHQIKRISINPQTMQQKTLDLVGRRHTVEEIKTAFSMARELGFENINMDLIAGLPGETLSDMEDTLSQIGDLDPDSLTVHSLAIKRAARMDADSQGDAGELEAMIDMAAKYAKERELLPYYLYRQKNISGNFENVGYAKVDKAGIYNILIMEEKQTILALGAGATTKIVLPKKIKIDKRETNIIRIENVKSIEDYIARIDEMIERKEEWLWH